MSHIPERKEKDCLNCGAIVQGRYCQACGQENVVPRENFRHMVTHFFYDITHFDSKFFDTLKLLILKPGFLPTEYIRGRRVSYLHPVKMYVFTSAVFFLMFFSIGGAENVVKIDSEIPLTPEKRIKAAEGIEEAMKKDSSAFLVKQLALLKDTSRQVTLSEVLKLDKNGNGTFINITGAPAKYKTVKDYDSAQHKMLPAKRDNWLIQLVKKREINLNQEFNADPGSASRRLSEAFIHKLPYLLFVSLPLFAFFLKLLYIRRKKFFYFDHAIFSVHHYIFTFILLLFVFAFSKSADWLGLKFLEIIAVILFLYGGFYLYRAMKNFYRQSNWKTILKFLLLNIAGIVTLVILFVFFVIFSAYTL